MLKKNSDYGIYQKAVLLFESKKNLFFYNFFTAQTVKVEAALQEISLAIFKISPMGPQEENLLSCEGVQQKRPSFF
jgi:hypothetical protein